MRRGHRRGEARTIDETPEAGHHVRRRRHVRPPQRARFRGAAPRHRAPGQRPGAHPHGRRPAGAVGRDDHDPGPAGAGRHDHRPRPGRDADADAHGDGDADPDRDADPDPDAVADEHAAGGPAPSPTPGATSTPAPSSTPARGDKGSNKKQRKGELPNQTDPSTLDPNAESLDGDVGGRAEDEDAPAPRPPTPGSRRRTRTARRRSTTRPTPSASPGPRGSASRTSSSRSSGSRRSCSRSTRPRGSSTGSAGRSSPRSTRSRPTTAATSTSPRPARSGGCSSCPRRGTCTASTATATASRTRTTRSTRSSPPPATSRRPARSRTCARAIFAYNHADWYVDSVILRARYIAGLPADLVGSLSGLTQGRFPVQAKATYASAVRKTQGKDGNPAYVVESSDRRNGIRIFAKRGAPVVAVNDGKIVRTGHSRRLGNFVVLQDVYGNTYTYGHLKSVVDALPDAEAEVGRRQAGAARAQAARRATPRRTRPPPRRRRPRRASAGAQERAARARRAAAPKPADDGAPAKERLFANPDRPNAAAAGGDAQADDVRRDFGSYLNRLFGLDRSDVDMKPLEAGARVTAGTVLGRIGRVSERTAPHLLFEIRPAGRGAPRIDPKPILDGWKLLESTAIYRAANRNPFVGKDAADAVDRPDPADEQGRARPARARRPERPDLRLRPPGHPRRPDRPPRAGDARVPRLLGPQADGHVAQVRPLLPDGVGQRVRAHDRHRGRHRRDQRRSRSSATRARARSPRWRSSGC